MSGRVRSNNNPWHSVHDELRRDRRFWFPNILGPTKKTSPGERQFPNTGTRGAPEQELSVQIADVNGVHIDNVDVFEPRQSEVREDFASQTSGPYHQGLALIPKERFDLETLTVMIALVSVGWNGGGSLYFFTGKERRIGSRTGFIEDLVHMIVSGLPVCCVSRPVQGHHSLVALISDRRCKGALGEPPGLISHECSLELVRSRDTLIRKCVAKEAHRLSGAFDS